MNSVIRWIFEKTPLKVFDGIKTYGGVSILAVSHLACFLADSAVLIPQVAAAAVVVQGVLSAAQPVADVLGISLTCAGGLHAKAKAAAKKKK